MEFRDPLWRRYLRFVRANPGADVDDELRFHWEELVRGYQAGGMDRNAAERAARAQFGDVEEVRRSLRRQSLTQHRRRERQGWWRGLGFDVRIGLRNLVRQRGFTAAAVTTLALGIGANAAVFSVVNSALLRPLPYPRSDRIVAVHALYNGKPFTVSPPDFTDLRSQSRSFTGMAAYNDGVRALTGHGEAQAVPSAYVTADFFGVMGVQPVKGRVFSAEELTAGQMNAVILSDDLWRTMFGAQPDVLGKTLQLDGKSYQIVGIMPPGFAFPSGVKMWTPWGFSQQELSTQRGAHYLFAVARLREGMTIDAADREAQAIAKRLAEAYPNTNRDTGAGVRALRDVLVGATSRRALLVLLGAVALVALIACANVANLLLARGTTRARELAMRVALGARPRDLIGTALTESLLLALLGGVAGVIVAWWATKGLDSLRPEGLRRLGAATVDFTVLGFALALSVATGFLFGLAPALQAVRSANAHGAMHAGGLGGRGDSTGRSGWRVRSGLVAAEVALALMLLAGAGLLIRSFGRLQQVNAGFDAGGILTYQISLPDARYPKAGLIQGFVTQLMDRARSIPGVTDAAAISGLPLDDYNYSISTHSIDGRVIPDADQPSTQIRVVTPDLFRALRIPLRHGRVFTTADRDGAPNAIILNEAAAKLLFNGADPVGHSMEIGTGFGLGRGRAGGMIIGVVGDVHDEALGTPPRPTTYLAHAQWPINDMAVVLRVRSGVDPKSIAAPAREQLHALDVALPVSGMKTLDRVAQLSVAQPRFAMLLLGAFATLALVLAGVGIFGVMSYVVGQRTRDIGVRMALGAEQGSVVRDVLQRAMWPVSAGVLLGLAGSGALTKTMEKLLFDVKPGDPSTLGVVAVMLILIGLFAAWFPARRASRVDPVLALRSE